MLNNSKDTLVEDGKENRYDPTICPACHRKLDPNDSRHRLLAFLTEGSVNGRFGPGGFEGFREEVERGTERK